MAYNDIYRLRVYATLHSSQIVNVMHFLQTDIFPTADAQSLANDFVTNMATTWKGRASNQMTLNYVEVQSIVPFSGASAVTNFPGGSVGTSPNPCFSATLAEVITIYTSRGGRRGRGRIYLAGAPNSTSSMGSGAWLSAQTTNTTNMANALAARYIAVPDISGFRLGVWSRTIAGPTPPWPTSAFVRATALTIRTTVRTQRRRQLGVGR